MRLVGRTSGSKYLKGALLAICVTLFAWSLGRIVFKLSLTGWAIGPMIKESFFPVLILGLILFLKLPDIRSFGIPRLSGQTGIGLKEILLLAPGVLIALFLVQRFGNLMHFSLVLVVVIGLWLSVVLILSRNDVWVMVVLILILPLLGLLEWDYRETPERIGGGFFGPLILSPSIIVIWTFFAISMSRRIWRREGGGRTALDKYILAWIAIYFISSTLSVDPIISLRYFFIEGLVFPLFFFMIIKSIHTKRDIELFLFVFIIFGLMRIFISFYFEGRQGYFPNSGNWQRAIFGDNRMGSVATIGSISLAMIPVALSLLIGSSTRLIKVFLCLAISIFLLFLIISDTRSQMLALVITTPLVFFFKGRRKKYLIVAAIIIALTLIIPNSPARVILHRFSFWTSIDAVITEQTQRLHVWGTAIKMIMDRPVLGIGAGMWLRYYPVYSAWTYVIPSAHNFWLHFGATGGIGLLGVLLILIWVSIRRAFLILRVTADPEIRNWTVGLLWSLAAFLLVGTLGARDTFVHTIIRPQIAGFDIAIVIGDLDSGLFFWGVMGLIFVLGTFAEKQ